MNPELILGLVLGLCFWAVWHFIIRKKLSDDADVSEETQETSTKPAASSDDGYDDPETADIRAQIFGNSEPEPETDEVLDAQIRAATAAQLEAAADTEIRAAEKTSQAARKKHTAEGEMLTAEGRRKARIDHQRQLNEEEFRVAFQQILHEKDLLETKIGQKKTEIEADAKVERERISSNEKISLERQEAALKEVDRKKEIALRQVEADAETERKRIDEQSRIDQQEIRRRQRLQQAKLDSEEAQENADRKSRRQAERDATDRFLNQLTIDEIQKKSSKRRMSGAAVATFYFLGFLLVGFVIIIATKGM